MLAVGHHRHDLRIRRGVGEDGAAAGRAVRRDLGAVGRAQALAPRGGDADAEAAQPEDAGVRERVREHAPDQVEAIVLVHVDRPRVRHAVEDADLVAQQAAGQVADQLHADVAVGHQLGRQRALDELDVHRALQPLEAERRLALAEAQDRPRHVPHVNVDVEHLHPPAGQVDEELVVVVIPQRALERGTHPAELEPVALRVPFVVEEEAAVALHVAAELVLRLRWCRRVDDRRGPRRGSRLRRGRGRTRRCRRRLRAGRAGAGDESAEEEDGPKRCGLRHGGSRA